jgi:transcriptional regulator of arginine metabolism
LDFYAVCVADFRSRISLLKNSAEKKAYCMKNQRHSAIKDLLVKTSVTNQDELRRKLAGKGIHVTQATLSRDIREMKLMKGPSGYALPNNGGDEDDDLPMLGDVLQNFGLEVRQAQNLLVVLTTTGGAQPVAAGMDYEEWDEVVGTIAGDNTVLIICADARKAEILKTRIEAYIA